VSDHRRARTIACAAVVTGLVLGPEPAMAGPRSTLPAFQLAHPKQLQSIFETWLATPNR